MVSFLPNWTCFPCQFIPEKYLLHKSKIWFLPILNQIQMHLQVCSISSISPYASRLCKVIFLFDAFRNPPLWKALSQWIMRCLEICSRSMRALFLRFLMRAVRIYYAKSWGKTYQVVEALQHLVNHPPSHHQLSCCNHKSKDCQGQELAGRQRKLWTLIEKTKMKTQISICFAQKSCDKRDME